MPPSELPLISIFGLSTYLGIFQKRSLTSTHISGSFVNKVSHVMHFLYSEDLQNIGQGSFMHITESLECTGITQKGIYWLTKLKIPENRLNLRHACTCRK
ncbi:hypothetical protein H1C71_034382 [Ictidomys tridecemlineatus]|nr:hypothetical protein H1C71_034382 [Ictidomys tridecemlineatus]